VYRLDAVGNAGVPVPEGRRVDQQARHFSSSRPIRRPATDSPATVITIR
jgi:hypothetical protein